MSSAGPSVGVANEAPYALALDALRRQDRAAAILLLQEVLASDADHRPARFNLGTALLEQGRFAEATDVYRDVLARDSNHVGALLNMAEALRRAGHHSAAASAATRAIAVHDRPAAYLVRGAARHELGDIDGAVADFEHAIAADESSSPGYKLLGKILVGTKRKAAALDVLKRACAIDGNDGESYRLLGDVCDQLGRSAEGFAAYRRSIEIDPHDVFAYANLSGLLCKTQLLDLALSVAEVGIKLAPDLGQLHYNRAMALEKLDRPHDALDAYTDALRRDPESGQALLSVCRLKHQVCDWIDLDTIEVKARRCSFEAGRSAAPFSVVTTSSSPAEILRCNEVWSQTVDGGAGPLACYEPRPIERRADRLRIGYISADFHDHATAQLIAEIFELHDKTRFETFGYSIGADDEGDMRQRLAGALDHFRDLSGLPHDDAAALIRSHDIDILVDLKGYTYQARPELLARRPAPIQVNFLGYPSTMGAAFIDYIIGDRVVTPLDHAAFYAEKIVQLPHTYQPNDRGRAIATAPTSREAFGLPDEGFVFCCLNAAYKITPPVFGVWMTLLAAVDRAVLWLYAKDETTRSNLRREASARGCDPARLVFANKTPSAEHLARMTLADLFLDTSPCGAHTTASEALWAGLPILTLRGETFASRVGASLLTAVGLPELIASSLEDYAERARHLADRPGELAALRDRLRVNRWTMPLFDSAGFTRDLETAFARMAALRDAGERPSAFSV